MTAKVIQQDQPASDQHREGERADRRLSPDPHRSFERRRRHVNRVTFGSDQTTDRHRSSNANEGPS